MNKYQVSRNIEYVWYVEAEDENEAEEMVMDNIDEYEDEALFCEEWNTEEVEHDVAEKVWALTLTKTKQKQHNN